MADQVETGITEITISPDGRLRIFGLSRELLELLHATAIIPCDSFEPLCGEDTAEQAKNQVGNTHD